MDAWDRGFNSKTSRINERAREISIQALNDHDTVDKEEKINDIKREKQLRRDKTHIFEASKALILETSAAFSVPCKLETVSWQHRSKVEVISHDGEQCFNFRISDNSEYATEVNFQEAGPTTLLVRFAFHEAILLDEKRLTVREGAYWRLDFPRNGPYTAVLVEGRELEKIQKEVGLYEHKRIRKAERRRN